MNWETLFEFRDAESARARQRELARQVRDETPAGFRPRLLCGLDAAYRGNYGVGVATACDVRSRLIVETCSAFMSVPVDYVPGLLGFREGPLVVAAAKVLRSSVDVFLADGHGRAHPRRFGLACQIGLALERPTVGVAKSSLYGQVRNGEIIDMDGTVLGRALKTGRTACFYVSVGHRINLEDAFEVVRGSLVDGRPAPLRAAHLESLRLRSKLPG